MGPKRDGLRTLFSQENFVQRWTSLSKLFLTSFDICVGLQLSNSYFFFTKSNRVSYFVFNVEVISQIFMKELYRFLHATLKEGKRPCTPLSRETDTYSNCYYYSSFNESLTKWIKKFKGIIFLYINKVFLYSYETKVIVSWQ